MIIRAVCFFIFGFMAFTLQAAELKSHKLSTTGSINLAGARNPSNATNIAIHLNQAVKGSLKIFQSDAYHRNSIKGAFFLNNSSKEKLYIKYRLVFKDKIGVIAQSIGEIHLDPGQTQRKKFGNIVLSEQDIRNVNSYQIQMEVSPNKRFR